MHMPNAERAEIDPAKLTQYLLNPDHPDGRGKAAFFELMGYARKAPWVLERDLLTVAATGAVNETVTTSHGTKYVVDGEVTGPANRSFFLRTVWLTRSAGTPPMLVTGYPRLP
jgi:hypothetical protein